MDFYNTTAHFPPPRFSLDVPELNNDASQELGPRSGRREGSTRRLETSAKTEKVYKEGRKEEKHVRSKSRRASLDDKALQHLSKQEIFPFLCEGLPNMYRDFSKRELFTFQKERKSDLVQDIEKRILKKDLTDSDVLDEIFRFLQNCIQYQGKGVIQNVARYILSKNLPDHKLIPFIEEMIDRSAILTGPSMPFAEDSPGIILYAEYIKRRFETYVTRGAFTKCALEVIENSQELDIDTYTDIEWTYWTHLKQRQVQLTLSFLKNVASLLKNIQEIMEKDKDLLNDVKILNHCLLSNIKKKSRLEKIIPEQNLLKIFVLRIICADFIPLINCLRTPPLYNDLLSIKEDLEYVMNITKLFVDNSEKYKILDPKATKYLSRITDFLVQKPAPLQEVDRSAEPDLENNLVAQILNLVPTNNADKDVDDELVNDSDEDTNTADLNESMIFRLNDSFRRMRIKEKKVKVII